MVKHICKICLALAAILLSLFVASAATASPADIADKAIDFIIANYLSAQGLSAELTGVTEEDSFYKVSFNILRDNRVLQPSTAYVTKDGKNIILGNVIDMSKSLPLVTGAATAEVKKSDKPKVQLFVMSFCPYGKQAEDNLYPVIKLLGDKIDFEPHFIVSVSEDGKTVNSLHGPAEVQEDMRQAYIWKYYPDKFWNYLGYINENCNLNNIGQCWTQAAREADIDSSEIEEGLAEEGVELMKAEAALANKFSASGSPTLFINELLYQGGRTLDGRSPEAFKTAICSAFNSPPPECQQHLSEPLQPSAVAGSCGQQKAPPITGAATAEDIPENAEAEAPPTQPAQEVQPAVVLERCANSCEYGRNCVPYSTRVQGDNKEALYCSIDKKLEAQKEEGSACQNSYECLTNQCSNGKCADLEKKLEETGSLLRKLIDLLKKLFRME